MYSCSQVRMHGGTDVALAIHTASEHMQTALPAGGLRTLIMLSDGRIDKYQGNLPLCSSHTELQLCCKTITCLRMHQKDQLSPS